MRVKVGSVAFLKAAGSGFGIGLSDDGHRVEFIGNWRALSCSPPSARPLPHPLPPLRDLDLRMVEIESSRSDEPPAKFG